MAEILKSTCGRGLVDTNKFVQPSPLEGIEGLGGKISSAKWLILIRIQSHGNFAQLPFY